MLYDNITGLIDFRLFIPTKSAFKPRKISEPQTERNTMNDHDHAICIEQALKKAQNICQKQGVRLTVLREQILRLIWQSHKPMGAYLLMNMLEENSDRERVAPPTVYRTLDFLIAHGLIHKVHSLNAYVGCASPHQDRCNALFICSECGDTSEVPNNSIQQAINLSASQHKFTVENQMLEIMGKCQPCRVSRANP